MDPSNDILGAIHDLAREMRDGFTRVDARFEQVDARFEQMDARFEQVDARFEQVDARFEQVDARFEQVDARFEQVDARFAQVNGELAKASQQFDRIDERSTSLRSELAAQFDALDQGLRATLRAEIEKVRAERQADRVVIEALDRKIDLVGENVGNVLKELGRYQSAVEAPLERRVTDLEGRVWILERKNRRN
jgi:chromosome segregation ATPase